MVRGGRALRMPLFELVDSVDLTNIAIDIEVKGAYSKGGIPLNVHGVANVKLPGEEPLLNNAIERFLGRTRQEIMRVAKETLEGNLRGVLAQLTPEEVNQDKIRFAEKLLEEAEHDLYRMGLVLDTLKIQNITDDVGYLNSIGRIQGARVRMDASVAEARAVADANAQQSLNWCASQIAKVDADLAIAQQETNKRVVDAQTRRVGHDRGVGGPGAGAGRAGHRRDRAPEGARAAGEAPARSRRGAAGRGRLQGARRGGPRRGRDRHRARQGRGGGAAQGRARRTRPPARRARGAGAAAGASRCSRRSRAAAGRS